MKQRREDDSMGPVKVPEGAYYGAQTQRAVQNGLQSGLVPPREMIHMLGVIKYCAAKVNSALGLLDAGLADAVCRAADEVAAGKLDDHFVVDLFQTGSGTSTNMNVNEVIAGRANQMLTGRRGGRSPVHPNDHVNLGQSSNDVIPTAIHMAAVGGIRHKLIPALEDLFGGLKKKGDEFAAIVKLGRTHLQDALPLTLGQEFGGYARQLELSIARIKSLLPRLSELALGGTAVGTGANTHPEFASRTIEALIKRTGIAFTEAGNHFEAQASRDALVETSGCMKTIAVGLVKIAADIRLMASGPRGGLGELKLPAIQPGSSMMPGKVNPVVPEIVIQTGYQVMGNDTTATLCGQSGILELNTTMPLLAHAVCQSIDLLAAAARLMASRCVAGLRADEQVCGRYAEQSLALATVLVPYIGYDKAAELAKQASRTGRTIGQVARENGLLSSGQVGRLLTLATLGRDNAMPTGKDSGT